jgi:hypothetical protein
MSPELALVDPALAERTRAWLPEPGDTLRRVERLAHAHRIAASRASRVEAIQVRAQLAQASDCRSPSHAGVSVRHRCSVVLAGGVATGVLMTALLVGVRIDLHGSPAGADTTQIGEPPAITSPETRPTRPVAEPRKPATPRTRPNRKAAPSKPKGVEGPRRFAWAPVAGSSGYHVEFFRGSSLIYSADTKSPGVSIPASWRLGGRRQTLAPGEYRWYVWALRSGRRAAGAVVQATLVIGE